MKEKTKIYNITIFVSLSLITVLYFFIGFRFFLHRGLFDEGLAVYGAARLLNGDIPYRDFWTLYAPAEFYLLAWVFKIFGASIIVERILSIIIHLLIVMSVYLLIRGLIPKRFIFLAWLLALAWLRRMLFYSYSYSYTLPPAIFFVLLSCLTLKRYFLSRQRRWLVASGIIVSIVTLFRQDFGFYAFISEYLVIFIFIFHNLGGKIKRKTPIVIKESLFYLLGNFVILLPVFFYFLFNSAIVSLIQDVIIFPLVMYPKVRAIPFPRPSPDSLIFYFPIAIFILTAVILIADFFSKSSARNERYVTLLLLFLGITMLSYPCLRAQIRYLFPSGLLAIILFIYSAYRALQITPSRGVIFYRFLIYSIVFIITITLFIVPVALETKQYFLSRQNLMISKLSLVPALGCYDWDEGILDQQRAIKFIQKHLKPGERIFVGNARHDRIINNNIMFYFLSERQSATKYHELHPGSATTEQVQREIIDEIKKYNVKYIVLCGGSEGIEEPNQSNKSSGVFLLDNFIQANYTIEKAFGTYTILRRI